MSRLPYCRCFRQYKRPLPSRIARLRTLQTATLVGTILSYIMALLMAAVTWTYQSNGKCTEYCNDLGTYAFAVIQYKDCWCSNYIPSSQTDLSSCQVDCPGFPDDKCGNQDEDLYIYLKLDGKPSGTAKASQATSSSVASSTTVSSTKTVSSSAAVTISSFYFTVLHWYHFCLISFLLSLPFFIPLCCLATLHKHLFMGLTSRTALFGFVK